MLDIFSGLRLVVKRRNINIDNAIFRCHWFFTSTLLVSFSLIITARQYVGQPIECHSTDKIPDSLLNSYCWVQSTFTVPQACNGQTYGVDVPYPCIDNTRGREVRIYAYYQWVGIVLFVQGLLFHLPYYLWKLWENGLIKAITGGLRVAVLNEQERLKKKNIVVEYIYDHFGCHKRYAMKYFLCEFICLINLFGQLWATNKFFDGQFLRYGIDVIHYSATVSSPLINSIQTAISSSSSIMSSQQDSTFAIQSSSLTSANNQTHSSAATFSNNNHMFLNTNDNSNQRQSLLTINGQQNYKNPALPKIKQQVDPMTFVFPRMTKCSYYDFGSSGDVQKHDALCLLPLNIINEKIYIALWFWFLILAILTILVIIYRIFAIISENVRCKGLISRCKLSSERDIELICHHCDVGDWFLFYMVAENLDPLIMREIVSSIASKINEDLELKREPKDQLDKEEASNERERLLRMAEGDTEKLRFLMANRQMLAGLSGVSPPPPPPPPLPPPHHLQSLHSDQAMPSAPPPPSSRHASFDSDYLATIFGLNQSNPSRRNSIVDQLPYVKKIKKRIYNRRMFSADLDTRGQTVNSENNSTTTVIPSAPETSHFNHLSAAGDTQLQSAPLLTPVLKNRRPAARLQRRGSLNLMLNTRSASSDESTPLSSGVSSSYDRNHSGGQFIMEMDSFGSTSRLDRLGHI